METIKVDWYRPVGRVDSGWLAERFRLGDSEFTVGLVCRSGAFLQIIISLIRIASASSV